MKTRFLTNNDRKRLDNQFQTLLRTNHDTLLGLCNARHPETVEGVLAVNPNNPNPQKTADLNKRINAQSERIENLLLEIDPRFR